MKYDLTEIPDERRCNAKTRSGEPCKKWTMQGRNRCRMHGGKSFRGHASPRYIDGWYSKDWLGGFWARRARAKAKEYRHLVAFMRKHGYEPDPDEPGHWKRIPHASVEPS